MSVLNNIKCYNRSDSLENWVTNNPVLGIGEFAVVSNSKYLFKIGNGTSNFSELPFPVSEKATRLETPRKIGNASFDGTSDISLSDIGAASVNHTHTASGETSKPLIIKLNNGTVEDTNLFTYDGGRDKTINITPSSIGASDSSHAHNYAGSNSPGGAANSVSSPLLISLNGVSQGNYDGSSIKTINITPESIGALPLTGGTLTGTLSLSSDGGGILISQTGKSWLESAKDGTCIRILNETSGALTPFARIKVASGAWVQSAYDSDGSWNLYYYSNSLINSGTTTPVTKYTYLIDGTIKIPGPIVSSTSDTTGVQYTDAYIEPINDASIYLGSQDNRWNVIYARTKQISTSDENEKDIISGITESYEKLFMDLKPILYKWKQFEDDDHIHDRIHCGLGAQSVLESAKKYGLDEITFGAICRDRLKNPTSDGRTERYGLIYDDFHGLQIHMIQKNRTDIDSIIDENKKLKEENQNLRKRFDNLLNTLQNQLSLDLSNI